MEAVIGAIVNLVTGVFDLTEADWATIGINMIMGLSMFLPMAVGQLSFGQPWCARCMPGCHFPWR
jgi:hypothetical protein